MILKGFTPNTKLDLTPSVVAELQGAVKSGEGNLISITRQRHADGKVHITLNGKAKNSQLGEVNHSNEIANSRYSNEGGVQVGLDGLTAKIITSIERMVDIDYELDKVVDTKMSVEPHKDNVKYEIMGTSTATSTDLQISANYNGALHTFTRENAYAESERRYFGFSIKTTFIEMQQAAVSIARYDEWDRKVRQIMMEIARIKQELKAFGIQKTGGRQGGLFNFQGLTIDTSTITKPINEMSMQEINSLAKNLLISWQAGVDNIGGEASPTHFLMPFYDRQLINAQRDPQNTAGILSYYDILSKALSDASGNPINIIGSTLAQKKTNTKFGFNKDYYGLINKPIAGLFQDVPVDMQALVQPAQNGLSFEMLFIFQVGEVFADRPEFAKIFAAN